MDFIGEMVRNVVMIVLLAAFMEMLVPGEEMGRYVRLVMGLFVIVALLSPVLSFINDGESFEVTAYGNYDNESGKGINTILKRGEEIRQQGRQAAMGEYRVRLARQVQAVVQLVRGVRRAEVEIEVEDGDGDGSGPGAILRVAVLAEAGADLPVEPATELTGASSPPGMVAPVKPVEIKPGTVQSELGGEGTQPPGQGTGQPGNATRPSGKLAEPIGKGTGLSSEQVQSGNETESWELQGGRPKLQERRPMSQTEMDTIKREIVQTVSNFYSIRPEQVQVIVVAE